MGFWREATRSTSRERPRVFTATESQQSVSDFMSNIDVNKEYKLKDTAIAAKKKQLQLEIHHQLDANHQSHQTYGSKKKILEEEVLFFFLFRSHK